MLKCLTTCEALLKKNSNKLRLWIIVSSRYDRISVLLMGSYSPWEDVGNCNILSFLCHPYLFLLLICSVLPVYLVVLETPAHRTGCGQCGSLTITSRGLSMLSYFHEKLAEDGSHVSHWLDTVSCWLHTSPPRWPVISDFQKGSGDVRRPVGSLLLSPVALPSH